VKLLIALALLVLFGALLYCYYQPTLERAWGS
jgi:hypothetical protein